MNCVYYLVTCIKFQLKKQDIEKILEKWKKILEKFGNFVSPEMWKPYKCLQLYLWGGGITCK